jgi:hypothetical protein
MDDTSLTDHIESLVEEEKQLLASEQRDASDAEALAADRQRLDRLSIELDRCWDLLRQRRALRDAGQSPEAAHLRDPNTVERYEQ